VKTRKKPIKAVLYATGAILLAISMVAYPKEVFEASRRGLDAWWNIVFPALLPFFIISHLLMSFGIVHFMGVLLEPLMKPVFNVPGNGAFVMAMGYTSGFPIGSVLTADLRKNNLCTRIEGERLISFTNNASPLFIFGAVAIGMFQNPQLGAVLAAAHYCANLCMGLLLRFHGYNDPEEMQQTLNNKGLLRRSIQVMLAVQQDNQKPLGQLLGEAIKKSVVTLSSIGGFIILFSVVMEVLLQLGIIPLVSHFLGQLLVFFGMDSQLSLSLSAGLFEVTLGAKIASEINVPLYQQLIAVSMVMGWSGLSVHAQVASIIADTDLRFWPFVISRIGHGILATLFITLFWGPAHPVFSHLGQREIVPASIQGYWRAVLISLLISLLLIITALVLSIIISIRRNTFGFRIH